MQAEAAKKAEVESSLSLSPKQKQETYNSHLRRSVFNITLADTIEPTESAGYKDMEKKLEQEIKEWTQLWKGSRKAVKTADSTKYTIDISLLPEDKRQYLEQAPNFQMFVRNSMAFRDEANIFLNFHLPESLQMQHNFKEIYEHRLNVCKNNAIKTALAENKC